ncbi:MAG TPA: protein kinase [Gemmatimonadaceae bacterium]
MDGSATSLAGIFAARYTVEGTLGRGATSTVYRARDTRTDRPVAIKVLRRELAEALGAERFLREIRVTEGLHHPRVLPVLDSGDYDGQLFFVVPFMNGGTLREKLNRESQLPLGVAVTIACTVAEALAYAHAQGFIHRDVKPENILFSGDEVCLADFGIARAIERSIEDTTTSTGIARGTPAYMSPEQASAAKNYDGRSDIYSLACVLYEMVTGMRPFLGPTTQAVISQRFVHPPRALSVYRNVPPKLESVIMRALQMSAADRYQTADEFVKALRAIPAEDLERSGTYSRRLRDLMASPAWRVAAGTGVLVLAFALAFTSRRTLAHRNSVTASDTTRLVLLPLEGATARTAQWHDDDLLHQALSRWRGLYVADQFQVADGVRRVGAVESTDKADELARSLGAGRYMRGRLTEGGDGWRAHVALYEIGNERPLYAATEKLPSDFAAAAQAYERLADSVLLRGGGGGPAPGTGGGTLSLPAVQAFGRAQTALDQWDLTAADSALQAASAFDPDFARASLWMAQVRAWRGLPRTSWSLVAERALALSGQLSQRERDLTSALVFLGNGEYARACDVYSRLRDRNDHDFAAWYGLGQCRMMDNIVIADPASPSGWRFRANVARAMAAYARAFEILPSVHRGYERGAFESLGSLLLVSQNLVAGHRQTDSAVFYGRLGLVGDSLVMVAFPWQEVFSGDPASIPPGFSEALARRRADFRRIAAGWSAAFPENAAAKHAVAAALELLGDASSIDTIRLARRLERDSTRRVRLAAQEVVLLVKFGVGGDLKRLAAAHALADSLLATTATRRRGEAGALASVAALSGRCSLIDALVRDSVVVGYPGVPASLLAEANVLAARLAMGCRLQDPTLRSVWMLIERMIGKTTGEDRGRLEQMLLYRPVVLAPLVDRDVTERLTRSTHDELLLAARAVARGDRNGARAALALVAKRSDPGAPTPDITLARARLWLDAGDSTSAAKTLDTSLGAVLSYGAVDLADPVNAGALVSMMVLRGELAGARSDSTAARFWRSASRTLWSTADADVRQRLK